MRFVYLGRPFMDESTESLPILCLTAGGMITMVGGLEVNRTSPLERLKAAMEATRVEAAANARDGAYHAWIQRFRTRMAERPQEGKDWSSFQTTRQAEEQRIGAVSGPHQMKASLIIIVVQLTVKFSTKRSRTNRCQSITVSSPSLTRVAVLVVAGLGAFLTRSKPLSTHLPT